MNTWSYKTVRLPYFIDENGDIKQTSPEVEFDKIAPILGEQGWELVSIAPSPKGSHLSAFFKRFNGELDAFAMQMDSINKQTAKNIDNGEDRG